MKELNNKELRQLQLVELEILKDFNRICKKNNLKYILVGGTLIGAIRHNGFIPWDDDIDVGMLREDYNKFIKISKEELSNKYYFQSVETEKKYGLCFGKIRKKNTIYAEETSPLEINKQGIWIDIFPIDNIGNNKIISYIKYCKIFYYKTIISFKLNFKYASKGIKKIILNIIKFMSFFYSLENTKKKFYKEIEKCNNKEAKYVVSHGGIALLNEIIEKKYFKEITTHKFEDSFFYIPKDYDNYLKHFFNDYMTPPPIEQRKTHHLVKDFKLPSKNKKDLNN